MIDAAWHHTSLAVRDVAASATFFEAAFGFETTFDAPGMGDQIACMTGRPGLGCHLRQMTRPGLGHVLELIAFTEDPAGGGPPPAHVSMIVPSLDAARAEMERLGAEALGEETAFAEGRALYMREPGGAVIEIEELTGGA